MFGAGKSFLECLQGLVSWGSRRKGTGLRGPKSQRSAAESFTRGMMKRKSQEKGPQCGQRSHEAFPRHRTQLGVLEGKDKRSDHGREGRSCRPGNWLGRVRAQKGGDFQL